AHKLDDDTVAQCGPRGRPDYLQAQSAHATPGGPALQPRLPAMNLDALTADVLERCDVLARFSEEPGRLTRTFLRPPVREVHESLTAWMREAGLTVRVDAIGNLIGHRAGR